MKRVFAAVSVYAAVTLLTMARPGDGIHIGNLVLSPFADLSATYDSNVFLTGQKQQDDFYGELIPGLAFLKRSDSMILKGRGWGQFRRYLDFSEKDSEGFGERVGLLIGTEEDPLLTIEEKYMRIEDYEVYPRSVDELNIESQQLKLTEDRTERVERDIFDIGAVVGRWVTDDARLDVGVGYSTVDYDTGLLFDWQELSGQVEGRVKVTDKSSALLTGQYSVQDSDGFDQDAEYYLARLGVMNRTTGKTTLKGGVGFESYDAGGASLNGENLDKDIVNFDIAAAWDATPRLQLQASGRNGIQPATQYQRNTKEILLVSLGAAYKLTDTIMLSLAGSHRGDDYVGKVAVGDGLFDKQRDLWGARARIDYKPHAKFFELYLEGSYEDVSDNLEDDYENYDQLRVTAGIFVRY